MKKTISVNLGGLMFNIEEDAFNKLNNYLDKVRFQLDETTDHDEVMFDIESRIAENFSEKTNHQVIDLKDVENVIEIMGEVEDYNENQSTGNEEEKVNLENKKPHRLYRNPDDVIIAGVCSGIAAYFNIDPVFIRLLFVLLVIFGGSGILVYLILWLIVPEAKTTSQKLEMSGQTVTITNIQKKAKAEYEKIKEKGIFRKILLFPIAIIKAFVNFCKRIFYWLLPVCRVCLAILLVGFSLVAFVFISIAGIFAISNVNTPYLINYIPIQEIIKLFPFYISVISFYLFLLIPIILFVILSISLIKKRNLLNFTTSVSLGVIWILSAVVFFSTFFNALPNLVELANNNKMIEQSELNIPETDFENLVINNEQGNRFDIKITNGDTFKVVANGRNVDLNYLEYKNEDKTLFLNKVDLPENDYCISCYSGSYIDVNITVPYLKTISVDNSHGYSVVYLDNMNQTEDLNLDLKGNSELYFTGINVLNNINLNLEDSVRADVIGKVKNFKATLVDDSTLNIFGLEAQKIELLLSDYSKAKTQVKNNNVNAVLHNESELFYIGEAGDKNLEVFEEAQVIPFSEYSENKTITVNKIKNINGTESYEFRNDFEEEESELNFMYIDGKKYYFVNETPEDDYSQIRYKFLSF